jgi:hypothetical protein
VRHIKPTLDELRGVLGGCGFAKVKSEDLSDATELHKEMTDHLASTFGKLLDDQDLKDSSEIAIYWFANDHHRGQADPLYSILSQSPYTPGPMMSSAADEGETVDMLYQELVDAFSNPGKPISEMSQEEADDIVNEVAEAAYSMAARSAAEAWSTSEDPGKWIVATFGDFTAANGEVLPEDEAPLPPEGFVMFEQGRIPAVEECVPMEHVIRAVAKKHPGDREAGAVLRRLWQEQGSERCMSISGKSQVYRKEGDVSNVAESTRYMSAKYVSDILGIIISDIMKGRAKWALDNLQKLKKDLETGSLEIAERK